MKVTRTISQPISTGEVVVITRWSGGVSCSLQSKEEAEGLELGTVKIDDPIGKIARAVVDKVNKIAKEKPVEPDGEHPFKSGDNVLYDGKPFTIRRAYFYKGKPLCILSDKRQVSANRLTLNTKSRNKP